VARRRRAYYLVDGFDLAEEMERLRALPVFASGELARRRPELKVRRAGRRPNRVGFAIPSEWRISVTAYPGARRCDLQETLLHELVHLHVGEQPGDARRWHGRAFREGLHRAMREAYGVDVPLPRSVLHGTYAEAIERLRRPEQLALLPAPALEAA
jgi:hypothetical protein